MKPLPRVVLLAKTGSLKNEQAILTLLKAGGYPMTVVRDVTSLLSTLECEQDVCQVAIVDINSTMQSFDYAYGYRDFLRLYARTRLSHDVNLIVIQPKIDQRPPSTIFGFDHLVTCYISQPVNPAELLRFLNRIAEDENKWIPLRPE